MAGTPCLRHVNVLLAIIKITTDVAFSYEITVDVERPLRKLDHFWRSTGFWYSEQTIIRWAMQRIALNPPLPHTEAHQFVLSKDQQLNLAYVSSVPNGGIQQIRIHWMLEMVSAVDFEGEPQYNFTKLDKLIDLLWINGLQPGFELMGSVSNYFSNFEDKRQVIEWRNFVYQTAKRYIAKYGLEVVSQWNFETWNEPNNKDFDNVTMSIQGFLNYYDASSEGLQAASIYLRFGGPGDSCHSHPHSPYCWAMLQHCYNGTNYFTGERGVRLDYIALHKKGGGHSLPILQQEVQTVGEIQQRFPRFRTLPVFNDEADPLVGWSRPLPWRADVTYAAMVVKVISQHQDLLLAQPNSTINYTLLSNDNAFLSYHPYPFRQRTLTARFQINNTKPPHVQLLRKPVLTVMGLLALLGETQVLANVVGESESTTNTTIGVLASTHTPVILGTSDSWQTTVMVFNSDDNSSSTATDHVSVTVRGLTGQKGLLYMTYYMDNNVSNPYQLWQNMGSPDYPTPMQFRQLRNAEDPQIGGPFPITVGDTLTLKAKLAVPSVFLIHVCAQPNALPDQVNGLRVIGITNGQVLIVWNDRCLNSKCIKTFEVELSRDGKEFFRVNGQDIFFTSFVYSPVNLEVSGIYRVRALDYWGRPGEYSLTKRYFDEH